MRYAIRRIRVGSALRVSLLLGWLVALCPAACVAGLAVQALRSLGSALARIETLDITVLGQKIATIDPLGLLQLRAGAESVHQLTNRLPLTFALLLLLLTLVGAALFMGAALLFVLGYNLLASVTGGLEMDLDRRASDSA